MDPYTISASEKARFEQQFASLNPINGIVTGGQAKGFFLQSQLPPAILGIIWGLADTDADGKMNINEFSIACKLISMKLRGFEIPKTLPSSMQLLVSGQAVNGTHAVPMKPPVPPQPPVNPTIISKPPVAAVAPINRVISPPSGTTSPLSPPFLGDSPAQPPLIPTQPLMTAGQIPLIASQPILPQQTALITTQPMPQVPLIPAQPVVPLQPQLPLLASQPALHSHPPVTATVSPLVSSPPQPASLASPPSAILPGGPSPPNSLIGLNVAQPAAQPSAPPLEKIPSLDGSLSGSPLVEWAIPQASRLKYTQLFNTTDRNRTGYLSGVQARNILLASQLPHAILAKIWSLADMDSDGRLSCEEFVLALHLCDMARRGEAIPSTLPPNLMPPTLRRQRTSSLTASDPDTSIYNVSFEDKRKENFEKGQAELEKRRKALLEIQRREQEERERKEREEQLRQERVRLEQERKRQEELERQAERQRELERAKEEERRKLQEQKLAARREMERQRQEEWEKQRLQELQSQRQKQQEAVLALKAKNQTLTIELTQLNDKTMDLSKTISETRCKVTSVKSTIDGMRATRDEQVSNQTRLKAQLKQFNQQLVMLTQQKAKMEATGKKDPNSDEQIRLQTSNKEINIKNIKDKNADLEQVVKMKKEDLDNNNAQIDNLKQELIELIKNCENMFSTYETKRDKVLEKRGSTKNASWGDEAWDAAPSAWPETASQDISTSDQGRYRALYEFVARNEDELSFQPGDIIMVSLSGTGEPGWLSGELRGATGWFPESYVEPVDGLMTTASTDDSPLVNNYQPKVPLEGIAEVSESDLEGAPPVPAYLEPILGLGKPVSQTATANFTFTPSSSSQLAIVKGQLIQVTEIQDQWIYGEVNSATGWFPKSYVTLNETADTLPVEPENMTGSGTAMVEGEWYVATYAYQSDEPGDLTFEQGQSILVIGRDGDWWTGSVDGISGIFPSNYVHKPDVPAAVSDEVAAVAEEVGSVEMSSTLLAQVEPVAVIDTAKPTNEALVPQNTGGSSRAITPEMTGAPVKPQKFSFNPQTDSGSGEDSETKKIKKPEIATVIAPYQASSSEQLSLQRGQLIMIRKKSTTGWWEGELQAKGKKRQIGWFPASYVKLLGGGTSSSQAKSPSPLPNRDSTGTDTNTEKVIALYQYTAQNEDELNFEKDDIITVVSRDEPAWWKGELNGAVGLFPSNYVGPVSNRLSLIDTNGNFSLVSSEEERRQQYILELINTEQAYIEDLSIVDDVFEKPLTESRILSVEQIKAIFINWHEILECNWTFLRSLRIRRGMSSNGVIRMIGDILCENIPRMTVYIRFCSCQLSAAALLQSLTETNKDFNSLSRRCQSDPRTQGLPLSSFLIKPMQRITKYPLLIRKILEQTSSDHPDRHYLEEAFSRAEELCSQVNEGVREKENCERLEWLQMHILVDNLSENLIFNSLTNSMGPRKLLHYGLISKRSGKELVGFLMNDFFLLAVPNRPLGHQFSFEKNNNILFRIYKTPLLLSDLAIMNSPEASSGVDLRLEYDKKMYHLCALTHNERNLWYKRLHEAQTELRLNEKAKFQRQQSKEASMVACGRVLVVVSEGRKLKSTSSVKREIFCEVSMGSQENRTPTVSPPIGESPKWDTSMQFLVKDLDNDVLCINIRDKGHFSPDEFLGRTEIRVSEILKCSRNQPGPIMKTLKLHEVASGEITLKLDLRLFNK